ncbi:MAG: tripartite tricarboxylate transporter substrate binding protein [Neisseriaceae bacterium]|nr:tripartite tricarboxylate transporter substrate binding protein [Neisseriaceae bacterium]
MDLIRKSKKFLFSSICLVALSASLVGCNNNAGNTAENTGDTAAPKAEVKYPSGNLDLVAPAGAGGGWDTTIRMVAKTLNDTGIVTAPMPVRNAPGAGGAVHLATLQEANKKADPNTITVYSPPILFFNLNGSSEFGYRNTKPLARLIADYGAFVVRADSPYKNVGDLMEALKKDPKAVKIGGTSAVGSMDHVQFLIIAKAAGVENIDKIDYVPFDDDGLAQLLGGHIDLFSTGLSDVKGLVESGDVRVLAQTADRRIGEGKMGEIPTAMESGIDATFINWRGLFGTPEMPDYAVQYWRDALKKLQDTPEWKQVCAEKGWDMIYLDAPEFEQFLEKTEAEYIEVMTQIGMLKK